MLRIIEDLSNPMERVTRVSSVLTWVDRWGSWKARWGINRMNYVISPGLYAVGDPDDSCPVLVTANYKMSFDRLRQELKDINAWILVLDTRGINVWCAAGKGTFGTAELVRRIAITGLDQIVSHRTIIVPQLGAPGVAAHQVRKQSGFKVVYGPVRAEDLPAFLQAGMKANRDMRAVRFTFMDRLVLTPIELVGIIKPVLMIAALLLILNITGAVKVALTGLVPYIGAILLGAVITPALLPWIPGRAFAWKGWLLGMLWAVFLVSKGAGFSGLPAVLNSLSYLLILPAISAFLAMNFTGASTYTSLSGVKREMKVAVPAIIGSAASGLLILLVACVL
ncbi:MAG TPA: mercury methylation corrinoid protein HgcA [Syntrophomonadaceae bacterium]|nr:mercury methylation corrinoid protein HgcA [Syntrophomonadaceae bacterium]